MSNIFFDKNWEGTVYFTNSVSVDWKHWGQIVQTQTVGVKFQVYQSLVSAQCQISALVYYLTYWECFYIDVCVLSGRRISNFYPLKDEENFEILWLKLIYLFRKPINPYTLYRVCQFIGIIVSIDQLHIIGIECMTHIIDKVIDLRFFNNDFVRPLIKQLVKVLGFVQTQCRPKTGASIIRGHKHYFRRFVTVLDSLSSLIYWLLT